jgi:hypothetical protein
MLWKSTCLKTDLFSSAEKLRICLRIWSEIINEQLHADLIKSDSDSVIV